MKETPVLNAIAVKNDVITVNEAGDDWGERQRADALWLIVILINMTIGIRPRAHNDDLETFSPLTAFFCQARWIMCCTIVKNV